MPAQGEFLNISEHPTVLRYAAAIADHTDLERRSKIIVT